MVRHLRLPLGLPIVMTLSLLLGPSAGAEPEKPSRQDVREAREQVADRARDVASVQADLVLANQRLQASAVEAAQAAEAWNGARYRLQQARRAARAAERHSALAAGDVERQQDAYADAVVTSYQLGPELTALGAVVDADGIGAVVDKTTTVQSATDALDGRYDAFRAAATLADVAADQAQRAREDADAAADEARAARDAAAAAADAAAAEAAAVAEEKDRLLGELARLQQISRELAERRQAALEAEALAAAAEAAEREARREERQEAREQAQQETREQQDQTDQTEQREQEQRSHHTPPPTPQPAPQPSPAPAPAGGAAAAVAFARAQLGEPYQWGAAGPSSWDCSGLTMGAWQQGGKSLPHYSVAQYEQATPIPVGDLRPGDLVFWGSSSSPSSIYHVALYAGDGQIIHAPRTGRPVTEESMYYWTPPNFHARP